MKIILAPGEMLKNITGEGTKPFIVEFKTNWDYGHMFVVDGVTHCTKYQAGDKKSFSSRSCVNMANGGQSNMEVEIITVW